MAHDPGSELRAAHEEVVGADFSGTRVERFFVWDARVEDCVLDGVRAKQVVAGAGTVFSEFVGCSFEGAVLGFAPGGQARFVGCSFKGARLVDFRVDPVDLVDCDFSGATLRRCIIRGRVDPYWLSSAPGLREVNDIRGNDFSTARLIDTDFRAGVDLTAQRLPQGGDYALALDGRAALDRLRALAASWDPGDRDTTRLRNWTTILQEKYDRGQTHLFLTRTKQDSPDFWDQVRRAVQDE